MGAGGRQRGRRQRGRRKQWTSRPAAGDLWTRHSVIALDPFVFKRSRKEEGWRWRGWWWWEGVLGRKWFTMTLIFQHFHPHTATTACMVCQQWDEMGG